MVSTDPVLSVPVPSKTASETVVMEGHRSHVERSFEQFSQVTAGPAPPVSLRSCLQQVAGMSSEELRSLRQSRWKSFKAKSVELRSESDRLLAEAPSHVQRVLQAAGPFGGHPALLRWSLSQIDWKDKSLVDDLLAGFPLVGDIPIGPESNPKTVRVAELSRDQLRRRGRQQVASLVSKAEAKPWSEEAAQVWESTLQEVTMGRMSEPRPITPSDSFVTRRFAVVQTDSKGRSKVRCIDDFLESLVNDSTSVGRRIHTGRLSDLEYAVQSLHCAGKDVVLLKSDFKSAYRGCPIRTSHLEWANILVNSPTGPKVTTSWAMPFGAVGAVYAWDRLGSAVAAVLRSFFLVPVSRYVDDLFWAESSDTAHESRDLVMEVVHELGLTIEVSKTPMPAKSQDILGVRVEVRQSHRPETPAAMVFSLEAGKAQVWLGQIEAALSAGVLSLHDGQKLAGRLCFGAWAIWGPESTSHTKSVYAHVARGGGSLGPRVIQDLLWWQSTISQSRVVRQLVWRPPQAVIYTDAEGSGQLAGVCLCKSFEEFWSARCPSLVSGRFACRKTQICAFESVAAVAVLVTYGQVGYVTTLSCSS